MPETPDYRQLYNSMLDAFDVVKLNYFVVELIHDKCGKAVDVIYREVSPITEKLLGKSKEQIIGKSRRELFGDISDEFPERFDHVAKSGKPDHFEQYGAGLNKFYDVYAWRKDENQVAVILTDITERKKAEETIKESEERFSKAFRGNQQAMAMSELDGKLIEVNTKFELLFGIKRQELIGHFMADFLGYGDRSKRERTLKLLNEGKEVEDEQTYFLPNGKKIDTTYFTQIIVVNGKKCLLGMWQDITERKKAEEALKESELRFRLALKNAPVSVAAQDINLRYVWAFNQRTAPPGGIVGKLDKEIFTPKEATHLDEVKQRVIKENVELREQMWLNRPSGRIFLDVTWSPIHDSEGKVIGVANATVDLTQMKLAEDRLSNSEQRWATTLSSIGDAVIATDVSGKISFMNHVAEVLTGWTLSEASLKPIEDIFNIVNAQSGVEVENPIAKVLREGMVVGLANHTILIRKDGIEVPIDDSGAPIKDTDGKTTGVVLVFRNIAERKQAEEALRKQASLIDLSPDAIIGKKLDDTITFWSQGAQKLYGWTKEEAIGKKSRLLLRTKFPEPYHVIVKALLSEGRWSGEKIHKNKFGEEIIVASRWLASCSSKNEIEEILETNVDITERKKAENSLAKAEAHYRGLFDNIDEGFELIEVIHNKKGEPCDFRYLEVNGAYEKQTGVKASEVLGKTTSEVFPGSEQYWINVFGGVERTGEPASFENYAEPLHRYYQTYAFPFGKNQVGVLFRDITERKKSEEALKENEQLYHTVFDNSQDGFQLIELIYDKNGKPIDHKFLKINHAYESIIGVKAEEILGKTARYISPNVEPHWLDVPDRVAKTGISEHVELYNKDIDKWLDCFYFLYSKNVVGTLFRDITERKKLQKQLQDSERLAAIGATAGMVGHDIRNPLQAITSDVFLAKTELDLIPGSDEKNNIQESLTEIEKNVDYINKIVADLQDYARPLKPNPCEVDLKLIIEKLLEKNDLPKNVKLNVEVEDDAKKLVADADYLNRILYNLVTNAIQAMPKGGKLTIHVYKEANDVVITVKDTGVGIPKVIQSKMFTPMFTTKSKGQGFGLPVVKRMSESLGGTVTFESEEGKGTTFFVRFPFKKNKT